MSPSVPPLQFEPRLRVVQRLSSVPSAEWDALDHGDSPFTRHAFLRALEDSGSVGGDTGWEPHYLLAEDISAAGAIRLCGAVPAWLKRHSYGEYVFDFAWAAMAQRMGLPYYPKLVVAVPMTPATGCRLLVAKPSDASSERRDLIARRLVSGILELGRELGCHSAHVLFCSEAEQLALSQQGFLSRRGVQFHFENRGYRSFDDFLQQLTSRRRKQLRKERQRARAQVDAIDWLEGPALSCSDLRAMDEFYRRTTHLHGGTAYLAPGFFERLGQTMPEALALARAQRGARTVAAALFLRGESTLFGRYWGASSDLEFLHFELAYYLPIERCITCGLARFEAGAQGEHKLLRGFEPRFTYSSHGMFPPRLEGLLRPWLQREDAALRGYLGQLQQFLPFKSNPPDAGSL